MKYLAVFFILVVCLQNVVPDETLDFKELFRDGYIGSLTGPSEARTRHFGGRWGGRRRRRWRPRPRPRPRPETDTETQTDTETEDEDNWHPPWWWPRPWRTTTPRTTTPIPTTTTASPTCTVTACQYYKARCDMVTDTLTGTFLLVEPKFGPSDEEVMTTINYGLSGIFPPYTEHGVHIHQSGDVGAKCANVGDHYNPERKNHAAPTDKERHAGDLGNINVTVNGTAGGTLYNLKVKLNWDEALGSVIERSIVVKIGKDDLGKGGSPLSLLTGNAGPPIGCCQILPVYVPGEEEWYRGINEIIL